MAWQLAFGRLVVCDEFGEGGTYIDGQKMWYWEAY